MAIFLIFRARHADYLSILAITKTFMNALKEKALFLRGFANRLKPLRGGAASFHGAFLRSQSS